MPPIGRHRPPQGRWRSYVATSDRDSVVPKPQIILLTDDPTTAGVMRLLLCDWGYAPIARQLSAGAAKATEHAALAIICDVVHASAETALATALALRASLRPDLPILISARDTCVTGREPVPSLIRICSKPMHPSCVRRWLDAHRNGGEQAKCPCH